MPAKNSIIANITWPGHLCIVAHDTVIANNTIMCNMAVCHDQAIVSHFGGPPVFAAPVNGYKFPNGSIITDLYSCIFTFIFKVLRNGRNNSTRENAAVLTNSCTFHNGYIAADPGAFTNFYILVNNTKRINLYIGCKLGIGMNVCMRMNHLV